MIFNELPCCPMLPFKRDILVSGWVFGIWSGPLVSGWVLWYLEGSCHGPPRSNARDFIHTDADISLSINLTKGFKFQSFRSVCIPFSPAVTGRFAVIVAGSHLVPWGTGDHFTIPYWIIWYHSILHQRTLWVLTIGTIGVAHLLIGTGFIPSSCNLRNSSFNAARNV